jgi:hypothetical protein
LKRLEEYRHLIESATSDLEARLQTIDEKLEAVITRAATGAEITELQRIKEERLSTQKCLLICAQLSELIDQLQPIPLEGPGVVPETITGNGMQECRVSMEQTTARLERHMQDILDRMMAKSNTTMTQEDTAHLAGLREEWKTARQCRDICSKADQHLKENISIIDNHATGDDTVQILVSNSTKTIHGKNRGYGVQIKQLGGHLSDQSIQKVSADFAAMSIRQSQNEKSNVQENAQAKGHHGNEQRADWQPHYGSGRTLNSQVVLDGTIDQGGGTGGV